MNAGNLSQDDLVLAKNLQNKYPDKIIELGFHPGYKNENLRSKYRHWGGYNWQKELEMLKSNKL